MTSIREAVAKHEQLRRRVSGLDWSRDPELSVAVNLDLSRPDRLDSLAANIPQIMMDLAQKKIVDENFKFVAWRPHKRSRPVLIPAPKNTVEDAMEAILEEMESEDDEIAPVVEEQKREAVEDTASKIEEEEIEVGVVEEKQPEIGHEEDDVEIQQEEVPVVESGDEEIVDSAALESLLRTLGLQQDADLLADNGDFSAVRRIIASHVGIEPRDMRLDRLLRLSLRLMPKGDEKDGQRYALLSILADLANGLSNGIPFF